MIYNVVLVSGVQQSDSVIHIIYSFFFRFFSLIGYPRTLNRVPCAIQLGLAGYLSYMKYITFKAATED